MLRGPSPLPSTSNQPSSTLSSFEVYTRVLKPPPLSSSKPLDAELQRLVHFILRDFISSWYSGISSHDEFYSEVVQTLAVVLGKIESRLAQTDVVAIFLEELPTILDDHIREYREAVEIFGTVRDGGASSPTDVFLQRAAHPAMRSTEAKLDHLRSIIDLVLLTLMPEKEVGADALRYLVREVLAVTTVSNALDKVCEPDFVADAVLKFIDAIESAPVEDSGTAESEEAASKPRARRPWHRTVSSHVVQAVTKRELQVLSGSQTDLPPAPTSPEPSSSFLASLVSTQAWSDRVSYVASSVSDLVQSAASRLMDASWRFVMQEDDEEKQAKANEAEERRTPNKDSNSSQIPAGFPQENEDDFQDAASEQLLNDTTRSSPPPTTTSSLSPRQLLRTMVLVTWKLNAQLIRWRLAVSRGPFQLGPIADTRIYNEQSLYSKWLELGADIFGLRNKEGPGAWVWTQFRYIGEPLFLWYAGGKSTLNRAALEMVAQQVSELKIAGYLRLLRAALWPDGQFNRNSVIRTEQEKQQLQEAALQALKVRVPPFLRTLLGTEYVDSQIDSAFAAFQDKQLVQSLIFRLIDVIVIQLFGAELDNLVANPPPPTREAPASRPGGRSDSKTPSGDAQGSESPEIRPTMLQSDILSGMESDIREVRGVTPQPPASPVKSLRHSQTEPLRSPARR